MRTRFPAIAVTALLSLTVVSCDSFLQTEPPLDISNDVALSTPAGIEAVMVGAADAMQSGALFGGNVMSMGELWSDNVESNVGADFGRLQILTYNLNIFNPEGRSMWGDGYGVINRVNNVLAALDNVPFDNPARAQQLRGRALAMRALTMWSLCMYFAQPWGFTEDNSHPGIIIRTEPTLGDVGTQKARATLAACYQQIIADFQAARTLLPPTDAPYMGSLAVTGLLARVYFHMGDWATAEALATEVIESGVYRLNPDVTSVVTTNSTPEVMYEIVNLANDNASSIVFDFRQADNASPRYWAGTPFVNTIYRNATDGRLALYVYRNNRLYVAKWDRIVMNIPILRYAEMYLTRSECRFQQGNTVGAVEDVNVIRERAGLEPLPTSQAGNTLLNNIRRERNVELAFEGDIFLERKRQRRDLKDKPWNDAALIFKIPDIEMNANTLCAQNP
ncbi:MAG: RagB/SusD family nutrient uptake outer membrane protein [Candidatus Kapaibacteriota bacterium]